MPRLVPRLPLLAALLLLAPRPAAAQQTPEQAAEQYFAQVRAEALGPSASLLAPGELERLKTMMAALERQDTTAKYRMIASVLNLEHGEIASATPERVNTGVLNRVVFVGEIQDGAPLEMLGHVMEGDTAHVLYRVKKEVDGEDVSRSRTVSLVRDGAVWRVLLHPDVLDFVWGFADMLRRQRLAP
ncbi:MAG TPA: hypothetical protein VFR81_14810 [Longimicrobium sp.]|nr:hypothetical protein [Longimicrobium sp.]